MSRRLVVTKDRYTWAVCGPWTEEEDVPRPWGPSTAPAGCPHRDEPHLHILFAAWEHAHTVALRLSQPSTLEPEPSSEG